MYRYGAAFSVPTLVTALLAVSVSIALLVVLPAPVGRHEWLVVSTWIVAAIALQGLIRSLPPHSMVEIFLSDEANAFYRVTQMTDARSALKDFADARAAWPLHAQSNMPGKIMLLFGLELFRFWQFASHGVGFNDDVHRSLPDLEISECSDLLRATHVASFTRVAGAIRRSFCSDWSNCPAIA